MRYRGIKVYGHKGVSQANLYTSVPLHHCTFYMNLFFKKNNFPLLLGLIILFSIFQLQLFAQFTDTIAPPNVLLIVVDDMGWKDVSYHGSEIQTPTIDRLAAEGVELNRFYVHPSCSPTRSSLMTGKAALRLGFLNPLGKNNVKGLPLSEKIMPQYFKEKGYQTNLVGKWHLGRYKKEYWPTNRGFDHFYGYLTGGIGHYNHLHGGGLDWERNGKTIREEGYSTHLLTTEAIKIINEKKPTQPLFLELCYAAPHLPNEAPESAIVEYQHLDNKNRKIHAAMVSEIDKGIQKIYETLAQKDLLENTIIWFMSDNGGLNFEGFPKEIKDPIVKMTEIWGRPLPITFLDFFRDNLENGASDNSPFKGGKMTVYEGGVRVPSFIYAPNFLKPQKVDSRITVNDVLPTLTTAVGIQTFDTTNVDGTNQWSFLKNQTKTLIPDFITHAQFGEAYYKDNWKLLLPNNGIPELYQLEEDPTETNNVAAQHPDIVNLLTKDLQSFPRGAVVNDPLWKVALDPDIFGGEGEDRPPYAGIEGSTRGPLHPIYYVLPLFLLGIIGFVWWRRLRSQ